jgi:hypothetical protein
MAGTTSTGLEAGIERTRSAGFAWAYPDELEGAVLALWEGTLMGAARRGAKH